MAARGRGRPRYANQERSKGIIVAEQSAGEWQKWFRVFYLALRIRFGKYGLSCEWIALMLDRFLPRIGMCRLEKTYAHSDC
jgi:hypothetical protein